MGRLLYGLAALSLALLAFALWSAAAQAEFTHPYTGQSFGPNGLGAEEFGGIESVAVDPNSGDVFVYETSDGGRVYKFNAAGEPVDFTSSGTNVIQSVGERAGGGEAEIAIDGSSGPAAGDIYVANNEVVRIYAASGSFLGELTNGETCGVAVDSSGAVYVSTFPQTVTKYTPAKNPVTNADETASMGGLERVCNLAVDSAGNVYTAAWNGGVNRYDPLQFGSPAAIGTLVDESGRTLAVDPSNDDLYTNSGSVINQYDSTGSLISSSGSAQLNSSFGVAVNAAGDVYAPVEFVGFGRIAIFGPAVILPDVATQAPSSVTNTTATMAGSVNPDGVATTYQFEYGKDEKYGSVTPASPASVGSDSSTHELSAELTGLTPDTVYHYRIVATNASGTVVGRDESFRTTGPPTVEGVSLTERTQTGASFEVTINPGGFATSYKVEYGASESYGSSTEPAELEAGSERQIASVQLSGLQLNTTYHYRVVATNSQGSVAGPDETFTTRPLIEIEESFSDVGSASANLNAQVNDFGLLSSFHYEYGTSSAYGSTTPETPLGATEGFVGAPATIGGLKPSTTYHFRLVASNEAGTIDGADVEFTTLPLSTGTLPDGRVYEMVTPPENHNANVYAPGRVRGLTDGSFVNTPRHFEASLDGSAVTYIADATVGGNGSSGQGAGNQYMATRSPSGWVQAAVVPLGDNNAKYQAFSDDLSVGFLDSTHQLSPAAPGGRYDVLYAHPFSGESYTPLFTSTPPNREAGEGFANSFGFAAANLGEVASVSYGGSSSDMGHVLFAADDALTPEALPHPPSIGQNDLYDFTGGHPVSVNVLPGAAETVAPNASFGFYRVIRANANVNVGALNLSHAISSDGSRIFWTDLNTGNLYVREDSGTPAARTVQADASVGGGGAFWTASSTGSRVFFTKAGDLYAFDTDTEQTSDLTPAGEVQGVLDAGEDGSYVYYVADAVLASGATAGQPNLYVSRREGVAWSSPVFIATLSPADEVDREQQNEGVWYPEIGLRPAESTPDGHELVFASRQRLTAYDNRGINEAYLYDAPRGELRCVSCNPSGEPPTGEGVPLPTGESSTHRPRWLTADGNKVFFDSTAQLVPEDINSVQDVYEWERDGTDGCHLEKGCISLLSSGTSAASSFFVDASSDGSDVFLTTRSQLTSTDKNGNYDLYDARIGGAQPPSPPACSGAGCQGAPPAPPIFATPSSATFSGEGNYPPPVNTPVKPKKLTKAQMLAKALKACAKKPKRKRAACRAQAKKRYGPTVKAKSKASTKSKSSKSRNGSKHHA